MLQLHNEIESLKSRNRGRKPPNLNPNPNLKLGSPIPTENFDQIQPHQFPRAAVPVIDGRPCWNNVQSDSHKSQ